MAKLGIRLDLNELEKAFKDLDANHDDVIDFTEFKNWFLMGMKVANCYLKLENKRKEKKKFRMDNTKELNW